MTFTRAQQDVLAGQGTAAVLNVGVAENNIPQMDATGYPAADGSQLTGLSIGKMFQDAERDLTNGGANDTISVEWTGFSVGNTHLRVVVGGVSEVNGSPQGILAIYLGDSGGYHTSGYVGQVFDIGLNAATTGTTGNVQLTHNIPASGDVVDAVVDIYKTSETNEDWLITGTAVERAGNYNLFHFTVSLDTDIDRVKLTTTGAGQNWDLGTAILSRDVE